MTKKGFSFKNKSHTHTHLYIYKLWKTIYNRNFISDTNFQTQQSKKGRYETVIAYNSISKSENSIKFSKSLK